jgi:DNA modification methylase
MNQLYYGDNLTIMKKMPKSSVDLIYLDPPFNSKRNYNLMYKNMTGMPVPEQTEAFCDTWEMDAQKDELARKMPILMREYGVEDYYVEFWRLWMQALRNTQPHLLAYLIYMVQRLLHMRVLLRQTGSIYLHCDPTASHYIKVMMDGIFGHANFQNEIIWQRNTSHNSAKRYGRIHDTILFYSKSPKFTWNPQYMPYSEAQLSRYHEDGEGRKFRADDLTAERLNSDSGKFTWRGTKPGPTRGWAYSVEQLDELWSEGRILCKKDGTPRLDGLKMYLDDAKGKPLQSIWTDIYRVANVSNERLGYPTQKPIALLERIIKSSSNPGDVVFDPFCGCGTTIYAAEKTGRDWIGCDIAILSIKLIREVLRDRYKQIEGTHFEVHGIPVSEEQAHMLFLDDPFTFQKWAVERVGGFPTQAKTGDKGIDGRLYFETNAGGKTTLKDMVLSVKGGNIRPTDLRDLRGVLERESNAEIAGFISLKTPTKAMREEASKAGMFKYNGIAYPRMQLLTIKEIVEEKQEFFTPSKLGIRTSTGQQNLPLTAD